MSPTNKVTVHAVTRKYLSNLDRSQLIDMLDKKTKLLLIARNAKIPDPKDIIVLMGQVELIQEALIIEAADPQ